MIRNNDLLQQRRNFVKEQINLSDKPVSEKVKELSSRLYLTERTVWNDLKY